MTLGDFKRKEKKENVSFGHRLAAPNGRKA